MKKENIYYRARIKNLGKVLVYEKNKKLNKTKQIKLLKDAQQTCHRVVNKMFKVEI